MDLNNETQRQVDALKDYNSSLHGKRIFLREVRAEDVNAQYYGWLNDPEVNRFLETRFIPQSFENILDYVKRMDGKADEPFFAICLTDTGMHIGNIKIGPINWYHRHADVSLFIGEKSLWGKGVGAEAISLVVDFSFRTLNLNKLKAGAEITNVGSIRAFEKCGFVREGLLRGHVLRDGREEDVVLLGKRAVDYWERKGSHEG